MKKVKKFSKSQISEYARMIGKLAKGKRKQITKAESERRRQRLAEARKRRWKR